jgi:hypothetical protein
VPSGDYPRGRDYAGGRWPALATAAGLALTGAVLAGGPASASPSASHSTAKVTKTVPTKKRWIVSDPAEYAQAVHSKDWVKTPEGLVYHSCAYSVPEGAIAQTSPDGTGEIKETSGAIVHIPACNHPTLADPAGRASGTEAAATASPAATASCENGDTNWWAETCWRDSTWINSLTENFSIPSNPSSDGALFFIFPGLEDSGQDSILQPMLNWGANGSIVTNPNIWYIMSEYFWSGNWVHSPPKHVNPPGTVTGSIIASGCNSGGGGCAWLITTSVGGNSTSITVGTSPAFTLPYTPSSHCGDYGSVSSTNSDLFWTP